VRRKSTPGKLRRRIQALELRGRQSELLAELAGLLQACQTVPEANAVLARLAPLLFPDDAGAFFGLTASHTGCVPITAWGDPPPAQRVFAPTDCWALRRGRTHVVDETGAQLPCWHVDAPIGAGQLCVPVAAQGQTFGIFHLQVRGGEAQSGAREVVAARIERAERLAEFVALALASIRLRAALREQSSRDPLTGLFNRRYMEESLDRELRRAAREGYSLGLIMADLDHLKRFNDAYGHAAGDMVLQLIGRFLRGAVRVEDIACRFGGEEFVIIMPKATLEDTERRAEAIRAGLTSQRLKPGGTALPAVTMSLGVAAFPEHGSTRDVLLHSADEALYRAKAAGRDRVVVAGFRERQGISIAGD